MNLSLDNPLLTNKQLVNSTEISPELAQSLRLWAIELIQSVGIFLKLPQVCILTASSLVQRFYHVSSFKVYAIREIAMGSLFLACKLEEATPRARELVSSFDWFVQLSRTKHPKKLELLSPLFFELRQAMVNGEMYILRNLGFNVHIQHPHGVMVNYLQSLKLTNNVEFCQLAWNYLNDGVKCKSYFAYPIHTLACTAIWLSARDLQVVLPENPPWYTVFDTELRDLEIIAADWKKVYEVRVPRRDLPWSMSETSAYLEQGNGKLLS